MTYIISGQSLPDDWPSAEKIVEKVILDSEWLCEGFPQHKEDLTSQLPKKIVDALQHAGYSPRIQMIYKGE